MAPLEPWEKVLVDSEAFLGDVHGKISCTDCHDGMQSSSKEEAHTGLISYPSADSTTYCGECHPDVVAMEEHSLHANFTGYWTDLEARSLPDSHPTLEEAYDNHCASCHTTCGDCHVSQPKSAGSGFIDGHVFNGTPSMTRNCTACHGSRVGNEYLGKHEDLKADIHFRQGRMKCVDCHTGHEMHGQPADCQSCHLGPEEAEIAPADHRYAGPQSPRCETCHVNIATGQDGVLMHETHGGTLSCQVCHSISYTSCDGCHVSLSEETGNPIFATEGSYLGFYIGKNPLKSFDRPYDYVTVRHVPVATTSFEFYGENLLANFDSRPTWTYATPHNIQLITPQTESCTTCHDNPKLFLTADKVASHELNANSGVIVDVIPGLPTESVTPLPENHQGYTACKICHEDKENIPGMPNTHKTYADESCLLCHGQPAAVSDTEVEKSP